MEMSFRNIFIIYKISSAVKRLIASKITVVVYMMCAVCIYVYIYIYIYKYKHIQYIVFKNVFNIFI